MKKKLKIIIGVIMIAATISTTALTLSAQAAPATLQNAAPKDTEVARGGFTISPANLTTDTHNFSFSLKAGESVNSTAFIKNFSPNTEHFYLYGADPTISNTGSLAYKTRDQSTTGPGSWIKFDSPELDLAPNAEKIVNFKITIPADTKAGNYNAGITMEKTSPATNAPGITIATRVVNHAKITVLDPNAPVTTSSQTAEKTKPISNWQSYYFWISLGLFLISLALLIWSIFYDNKPKAHHDQRHVQGHKQNHGKKK